MTCPWCDLSWRIANPISGQRYGFIHMYPADYKGLRAGVGPYCQRREEQPKPSMKLEIKPR